MKKSDLLQDLTGFAESILDDDKTLVLKMKGFSMYPALKPDDLGYVVKCHPDEIKPGDIVIFRNNVNIVAHRLIKIEKKNSRFSFIARGDHNNFCDPEFTENELIGKLVAFERNGIKKTPDIFYMKIARITHLYFHSLIIFFNQLIARLKTVKSIPSKILTLKEHYKLIIKGSARSFYFNTFVSVLQGIMPLFLIVLFKYLIDFLTKNTVTDLKQSLYLWIILALTAIVFFAGAILTEIKSFAGEKLSQSVNRHIYKLLHQKHQSLDLSGYENPQKQDKIHRAVQEASYRPLKLLNDLQLMVKSAVSMLILLAIFISIKWYLIAIIMLAVLPSMMMRMRYAGRYYELKEKLSAPERKMYYFNRILTGFPFAKELKLFGFSDFFKNLFNQTQDLLFTDKIKLKRNELRDSFLTQLWAVILLFAAIVYVILLNIKGELSIGTLVLFLFAFQRGFGIITDFLRSLTQIVEDNVFLTDFSDFIQIKVKEENIAEKTLFSLQKEITFNKVTFRYETSKREALKDISLTISAGKTMALVGENGSGKSTLIKLLCGFYEPVSGELLFDGIPSTSIGQVEICKNLAAVFQDFALYNLSVQENLFLGNILHQPDIKKAKEAVKFAGIDEMVQSLPNGYQTILGNQFLGGEELSFGQWQKIAIARAFYRDAPLLLLDEPSSALDARSESQIVNALRELTKNKTAVLVSHRLRTVQWVDTICFMEDGMIAEMGTHEELMQLKGKYFELYQYGNS